MEPLTAAAQRIVGYLAPIAIGKGVELANKLGKNVVDKIHGWLDGLRARWAGDEEAARTLKEFEADPEANADALRDTLADRMAKDPGLRESAEQLANDVGPLVVVTMKAGKVGLQEGPEFGRVLRGKVTVSQELEEGEVQRGPKFGDIG